MDYRRETLVMRAPGGRSMGLMVWERGARQGTLRCNVKGLTAQAETRVLCVAEGEPPLREGGLLRADADGQAQDVLLLSGDVPLIGAILADEAGRVLGHGFLRDRQPWTPERLYAAVQAQLAPAPRRERLAAQVTTQKAAVPEEKPIQKRAETAPVAAAIVGNAPKRNAPYRPPAALRFAGEQDGWRYALHPDAADPRGLAVRESDGAVAALWRAPAWPPPPSWPGAVWRGGIWRDAPHQPGVANR